MFLVVALAALVAREMSGVKRRQDLIAVSRENHVEIRTLSEWVQLPGAAPPYVQVPFWRRWLGEDPPAQMCFSLDGSDSDELPYYRELTTEFPAARVTYSISR
ncbi:MAG TPA: hypothetical protein VGN12_02630 [Pirellulales bacterium]|jgi:hypothetical protein